MSSAADWAETEEDGEEWRGEEVAPPHAWISPTSATISGSSH